MQRRLHHGLLVERSASFLHVLWEGAKEFLPMCVANGITGVRDLHTTMELSEAAQLRRDIENGTQVGPRLVYSGPLVDGPDPFWPGSTIVSNAVSGRAEVRRLHAASVDMVKVYEHLGRDTYFAIADECKRLGLLFGGHVPQSVNALECSDAGQRTIEHLSDVLPWCSRQPGETDSAPHLDPDPARTARLQRAITTAMRGQPDTAKSRLRGMNRVDDGPRNCAATVSLLQVLPVSPWVIP